MNDHLDWADVLAIRIAAMLALTTDYELTTVAAALRRAYDDGWFGGGAEAINGTLEDVRSLESLCHAHYQRAQAAEAAVSRARQR